MSRKWSQEGQARERCRGAGEKSRSLSPLSPVTPGAGGAEHTPLWLRCRRLCRLGPESSSLTLTLLVEKGCPMGGPPASPVHTPSPRNPAWAEVQRERDPGGVWEGAGVRRWSRPLLGGPEAAYVLSHGPPQGVGVLFTPHPSSRTFSASSDLGPPDCFWCRGHLQSLGCPSFLRTFSPGFPMASFRLL